MAMNYDEIRKTWLAFEIDFTEVRILGEKGFTASGYFSDVEVLIKALKKYETMKAINVFFVMNEIKEPCYSRQQKDIFIERPKETTSDNDIQGRKWLLIDLDYERPSGTSTSEEELQKTKDKANEIFAYLKGQGFNSPIIAESGNGVHMLYKFELANEPERTELIKKSLQALDMMFSDEVKVDTAVYNASRIIKLYGTYAQKGKSTEDRPHRESSLFRVPSEVKTNDVQLLRNLAKMIPEPPKRTYSNYGEFNIDEWLSRYGINVKQESTFAGGRKLILEECPFDSSHKGKDSAIFHLNNGAIGFKCFHASCSGNTWQDVRRKFEPNAYDRAYQRTEPRVNSEKKHIPEPKDEPVFFMATDIKLKDRSEIVSIPTGIRQLDSRIIGLNKGEVSCVSGLRGSGKSSLMSQWCLEAVNQKYKVALFSGELSEQRVLGWLQLQAAGRHNTQPTTYQDFFTVKGTDKTAINEWLKDKLYIYNNKFGNNADKILERVKSCIEKNKVDLVVLDNLMSMNLEAMRGDKYEKQTDFILKLMEFAKDHDVHILFVAHPRKALGFLRTDDISGTGDLTNAVDNVFIIHRVNQDFKNKSKADLGFGATHELYECSNVIEVCKNRDLGIQDYFVGLHYEVESKRFLNEKFEPKSYGWEDVFLYKDEEAMAWEI